MFQRDYILRMIEMMGDFMRKVGKLMDEFTRLKQMDSFCRERCGIPLEALESLTALSLEELLAPAPRFVASELLYQCAGLTKITPNRKYELLLKSFRLLVSLCDEGPLCEARGERVQELKLRLLSSLEVRDLMRCAEFLSQGERYADMEDAVFEAYERTSGSEKEKVRALGIRLLRKAANADCQTLALARTSSEELRLSADELEN